MYFVFFSTDYYGNASMNYSGNLSKIFLVLVKRLIKILLREFSQVSLNNLSKTFFKIFTETSYFSRNQIFSRYNFGKFVAQQFWKFLQHFSTKGLVSGSYLKVSGEILRNSPENSFSVFFCSESF